MRTRSSTVVLFSLRIAAASRSGQSERLTNSYLASATSPATPRGVLSFRFADDDDDSGRTTRSRGLASSVTGVPADSRKSWSDSATLRPIPAVVGTGCEFSSVVGDDVVDEPEEDRRERSVGVFGWAFAGVHETRPDLAFRGTAGMVRARGTWVRLMRLRVGEVEGEVVTVSAGGLGFAIGGSADGNGRLGSSLLDIARRSTAGEGMDCSDISM